MFPKRPLPLSNVVRRNDALLHFITSLLNAFIVHILLSLMQKDNCKLGYKMLARKTVSWCDAFMNSLFIRKKNIQNNICCHFSSKYH